MSILQVWSLTCVEGPWAEPSQEETDGQGLGEDERDEPPLGVYYVTE